MLQPPPELHRGNLSNVWFTALPALSGLGSVAYLLAGPPNPITYIAGSFFLVSALAMVVGSLLSARAQNRGEVAQQRWEFLRHLARTRDRVRRTAQAQRLHEQWGGPHPDALWSVVASPRLWERRAGRRRLRRGAHRRRPAAAGHPAGAQPVRPGGGPRPAVRDRPAPVHHHPPGGAGAAADGAAAPVLRDRDQRRPGADRTRPARWSGPCSAQAAVFHAPTELIIMVCTARPDHPNWAWVKWLPHAQHPTEVDFAGPVRLLDPSLQALEDLLGAELTRRSGFNPHAEPATDLPHVLIVLDGAQIAGTELALDPEGLAAVTVLDLDGQAREVVRQGGIRLEIDADGRLTALHRRAAPAAGPGRRARRCPPPRRWPGSWPATGWPPAPTPPRTCPLWTPRCPRCSAPRTPPRSIWTSCGGPARSGTGCARRSGSAPTAACWSWTSRRPPRTAWARTGC